MPIEKVTIMEDRHRLVPYTVGLTEALEAGDISPAEYVRRRALLVGQGDILQTLLVPLFKQIMMKFRSILGS